MVKTSVILPVINETFSLQQTVDIVVAENRDNLEEILIIIADKTTKESLDTIDELKRQHPHLIKIHKQILPYLGGALQEAFDISRGTHILVMASDMETDPKSVKELIQKAKEGHDIVAASRWRKQGHFKGYNPLKLILNKLYQTIFRLLYRTDLTDLTFAFRIYKTDVLKNIRWEELKHPFLLECLIKPLRLGYKAVEIPSSWEARKEGRSQNTFWRTFAYFSLGLRVFFMRRGEIEKI